MNNAPAWINGTYIFGLVLPDEPSALEPAGQAIAELANLLDHSVRLNIFLMGALGVDNTPRQCWDGPWPHWSRATFRINHDWAYLSKFMIDMRDQHNASIGFHVNLTDVSQGLNQTEETRALFQKLRDSRCIYARDGGECGPAYRGLASIPQELPTKSHRMPYVVPGDAEDCLAMMDYKQLWDSGLARQIIDDLYAKLPYAPPVMKVDVFTPTGCNLNQGYPDGLLGHSFATQLEGRRKIVNCLESLGSITNAEGAQDTPSGWCHGGLAMNDYSRIMSGFGQGGGGGRTTRPMQVYGNQCGIHLIFPGRHRGTGTEQLKRDDGAISVVSNNRSLAIEPHDHHLTGWGHVKELAKTFYLSVVQELYHIGKGNVRAPGGDGTRRIDEHHGRVQLDCLYLLDRDGKVLQLVEAEDAKLHGNVQVTADAAASGGKLVTQLDDAVLNGVTFTVNAPVAGEYHLIARYVSRGGGTLDLRINDRAIRSLQFPYTQTPAYEWPSARYGDYAFAAQLNTGANSVTLENGLCLAAWDDGTVARWDRDGFHAANRDVVHGIGFDRMWPDTWSGQRKIHFFSVDGCHRSWRLPRDWADVNTAILYPLTTAGRGSGITLPVADRTVRAQLDPETPYVLVPG